MRIALLDDDPVVLDSVDQLLGEAGYSCDRFMTGNALLQALRQTHYDLFVLDWNLPDVSGLSVLEWIRNTLGATVPVLLLTSRGVEEDVVAGLDAGADDFVSKPWTPAVLRARVAALARRTQPLEGEGSAEVFGPYRIDPAGRTIAVAGHDPGLTAKEYQLALLLFRNLNRAVSRQHILEAIWGLRADIPTRTLDSHITRLRTKLSLRPENGYQLTSVYGFGYRLEDVGKGA